MVDSGEVGSCTVPNTYGGLLTSLTLTVKMNAANRHIACPDTS
jgi:hypothetical protein